MSTKNLGTSLPVPDALASSLLDQAQSFDDSLLFFSGDFHIWNLTTHLSPVHGGVLTQLRTHPCLDLFLDNPIPTMDLSSLPVEPILLLQVEVLCIIPQ